MDELLTIRNKLRRKYNYPYWHSVCPNCSYLNVITNQYIDVDCLGCNKRYFEDHACNPVNAWEVRVIENKFLYFQRFDQKEFNEDLLEELK